jgi:hypothetical protein
VPILPACLFEPLWDQFSALLPDHPVVSPTRPLGCHRARIPDRVIFEHVIAALVHGSGYEWIASPGCSNRTIRRRLQEWAAAGLAEQVHWRTLRAGGGAAVHAARPAPPPACCPAIRSRWPAAGRGSNGWTTTLSSHAARRSATGRRGLSETQAGCKSHSEGPMSQQSFHSVDRPLSQQPDADAEPLLDRFRDARLAQGTHAQSIRREFSQLRAVRREAGGAGSPSRSGNWSQTSACWPASYASREQPLLDVPAGPIYTRQDRCRYRSA